MKGFINVLGFVFLAAVILLTNCNSQPAAAAHSHSWAWTEISVYVETGICGECGETEKRLSLEIGDIGPGGGIVFYRNAEGFTMTDDNSAVYYLEAAPENQGAAMQWASPDFIDSNYGGSAIGVWTEIAGIETAIGTGRKNTDLILAADESAPAASVCKNYNGGGKDDWFLPSKDELNELYNQRSHVGITAGYFWTSSQVSDDWAFGMNFAYGTTLNQQKNVNGFPRAVRAF